MFDTRRRGFGQGVGVGREAYAGTRSRASACGWGSLRKLEIKRFKGIRWMPWHREAMKDVARCDKPRGGASTR